MPLLLEPIQTRRAAFWRLLWLVLGFFSDRDRGQLIFLDGNSARVKPTIEIHRRQCW